MPTDYDRLDSMLNPQPVQQSRLTDNRLAAPKRLFGTTQKDEYDRGLKKDTGLLLLNIMYAEKNRDSKRAIKKILTLIGDKFLRYDAEWLMYQLFNKNSTDEYTKEIRLKFSAKTIKKILLPALQQKWKGEFNKEAAIYALNAAEQKKITGAIMFRALREAYIEKTGYKDPNIGLLTYFNPADNAAMKKKTGSLLKDLTTYVEQQNYGKLVATMKEFRRFLRIKSVNVLNLFQILKWIRDTLENTEVYLPYYLILFEAYAETYMYIVRVAQNKGSEQYEKDLPAEDLNFFNEPLIGNTGWRKYRTSYINRLRYACTHPGEAGKITDFMMFVHVLCGKKQMTLVNEEEAAVIFKALNNMSKEDAAGRVIKPDSGYPNITKDLAIGSYIDGLHIYYISNSGEFPNINYGAYTIYVININFNFLLFEISHESIGDREFKTFMERLYKQVAHIIPLMQGYFKVMAYLPVLVYAGPAVLIEEVIVGEVLAPKAEEVVGEINPVAGTIAGLGVGALGGSLNPTKFFPGKIDEAVILPGKIDDAITLPGKVDDAVTLPGKIDEAVILPGKIDDAVTLPGKIEDLAVIRKVDVTAVEKGKMQVLEVKKPRATGETGVTDANATVPRKRTQADIDEENLARDFDESIDPGFDVSNLPDESFQTAEKLKKGLFGERTATDALAQDGHEIILSKPDIMGTNQGGIDIVTVKDNQAYLIDNKALTTGRNVNSVSALDRNLKQNIAELVKELKAARNKPGATKMQQDKLDEAIQLIENKKFKLVVTNASLVENIGQASRGITDKLLKKGFEFIDIMRKPPKKP